MKDYDIQKRHYSLIIASKVLQLFPKSEIENLVEKVVSGLKKEGLFYCYTFSTEDIELAKSMEGLEIVEENINFHSRYKMDFHYFTKDEFLGLFSKLKTVYYAQGLDLNLKWGKKTDLSKHRGRLNGIIEYVGRRVR